MHSRAGLAAALAAVLVAGCAPGRRQAPAQQTATEPAAPAATIPFDHHVHLLGPALLRDWKSLGVEFSRPDPVYLSASTWLEPDPDEPGALPAVGHALLVPMAHLYGRSDFREALGISLEQERERVASENDHVAREAARYPGRAWALCSVAVLRPYASEELERCRREHHGAGVKVHLAASEVDLRNPEHLAAVERIAAGVEARGEILLLHLDPQRRGLETEDVRRFLDLVLGPHPELTVIVAHLGGSGGYGAWTRSVFRTILDWLAQRQQAGEARAGVRFDLAAVVLERESEGVPPTSPEEAAALAADLRAAGFDRLLFGSDAPVFDPRRTAELLEQRAGLTPAEMRTLLGHRILPPAEVPAELPAEVPAEVPAAP